MKLELTKYFYPRLPQVITDTKIFSERSADNLAYKQLDGWLHQLSPIRKYAEDEGVLLSTKYAGSVWIKFNSKIIDIPTQVSFYSSNIPAIYAEPDLLVMPSALEGKEWIQVSDFDNGQLMVCYSNGPINVYPDKPSNIAEVATGLISKVEERWMQVQEGIRSDLNYSRNLDG